MPRSASLPARRLRRYHCGGILSDAAADCADRRNDTARKEPLNVGVKTAGAAGDGEQCRGRRQYQCREDLGTYRATTVEHTLFPAFLALVGPGIRLDMITVRYKNEQRPRVELGWSIFHRFVWISVPSCE